MPLTDRLRETGAGRLGRATRDVRAEAQMPAMTRIASAQQSGPGERGPRYDFWALGPIPPRRRLRLTQATSARSLAFSQLTPLGSRVRFRLPPWARLLRRTLASEHRRVSRCASLRSEHRRYSRPASAYVLVDGATACVPATAGFDPRPLTFDRWADGPRAVRSSLVPATTAHGCIGPRCACAESVLALRVWSCEPRVSSSLAELCQKRAQ